MKIVRGPEENDKKYLVAGDEDGVIRIWTVEYVTLRYSLRKKLD